MDFTNHSDPAMRPEPFYFLDAALRRLLDISISLAGLVILSPIFLIIAIAIKRSSPGPVFYWGPRAGKGGKIFSILKFRTMYERRESYEGPKVTAEDDERITPLGRILRQNKINELPQLWNVLVGDMSMVGPRPEDPALAEKWPEPVRREVLSVRPGITSPASVVYRDEEDLLHSSNLMDTYLWDILPSKLRLDQLYIRNRSILTDLDVLFWTLVALIPNLKGISVPEHLLYWGPFSRFTSRYLGWFFIDFAISFLAVATAATLRRMTDPFNLGFDVSVMIALAIAFLFSLINTLTGLNNVSWSRARAQDALDLAFSSGIVTTVVLVANLVFSPTHRFPVSVIVISGFLSYIGFVSARYRTRLLTAIARYWMRLRGQSMTPLGERVLIVGAGEVARFALWLLSNQNLAEAFAIIGMVDDDPRKIGSKVDGYTVIHTTRAIPELVKKYDIGLILFAIADIQPDEQDRIFSLCQTTPARIIPIPDIIDSLRAQFPRNDAEREIHFNKVLHNATIDRLTGAYNRHHFLRLAEVEFTRSRRYGHPLSLVALSIEYGRPGKTAPSKSITTQVIKHAARRTLENIRGIDLLGRYDTHLTENILLVLLPETDETAADLVTRRLKEQITAKQIETSQGLIQTLVEVCLVTTQDRDYQSAEEMLDSALSPFLPIQKKKGGVTISETQIHKPM